MGLARYTTRGGAMLVLASTIAACTLLAPRDQDDDLFGPPRAQSIEIQLLLRLGERRLHLMQNDGDGRPPRRLESFPVAIGRREYETPVGRFEVVEKVVDPDWVQFDWKNPSKTIRRIPPGPNNPLGMRWIGFAAAHGWGIGFHGTPRPELLGQAVSHGCVRMHNTDVVKVFDRVTIGTPVIVEE